MIAVSAHAVLSYNEGIAMCDLSQSFFGGTGYWSCTDIADAQNNACNWAGVTCDTFDTHVVALCAS